MLTRKVPPKSEEVRFCESLNDEKFLLSTQPSEDVLMLDIGSSWSLADWPEDVANSLDASDIGDPNCAESEFE